MSPTIEPPPSWYTPRAKPAELPDDVACTWTATVTGPHRLLPDGCVDILWLNTGGIWICGPETQAWEISLPAGVRGIGVRFRPGVAPRMLGTGLDQLTNTRVRLADVYGDRAERLLNQQLGEAANPLQVLETAAGAWLAQARPPDPTELSLTNQATGIAPPSIRQLARDTGRSSRQVHRRSLQLFGYSPTALFRIVRLQRFVLAAHRGRARTVGQLAAEAGYYDQSHLWRDCRTIAGISPTNLLASHGWTFPTLADPYGPAASDAQFTASLVSATPG